eukprot:scaffold19974_cov82-Skeletonema_dohrnii-CCMP3373.AAC.1
MGTVNMLWVCYMIICLRYCCIGWEHHGVGLFCDRWQKRPGPVVLVCMAFIKVKRTKHNIVIMKLRTPRLGIRAVAQGSSTSSSSRLLINNNLTAAINDAAAAAADDESPEEPDDVLGDAGDVNKS